MSNNILRLDIKTKKKHQEIALEAKNNKTSNKLKVHLTPNFFFAKTINLILWSNLAQKFFDLVKSLNFYALSKYVKVPLFWFANEFKGAWVEDRM